jgi:uncharacterized membrane protein YcaP (DUF421 family)
MQVLIELFGEGKYLNALQMSCRAIIVFIITLIFIRIAGRRSFTMHAAFDNIIVILLGAILSRTVTGASPFIPTVTACLIIVLLHRLFAWLGIYFPSLEILLKGEKIPLYQGGKLIHDNMRRSLVSEEDIQEHLRLESSTQPLDLDKLEKIYMERNGKMSLIRKEEE